MRKTLCALLLAGFLSGCAPPGQDLATVTPAATATATAPPVTAGPTAEALKEPKIADKVALEKLDVLKPEMTEKEVWWADSGISDNALGYYASDKPMAELETELLKQIRDPELKPLVPEAGEVFSFEDLRVCVLQGKEDRMFVLSPLGEDGQPSPALQKMKLPEVKLTPEQRKGKTTLVVLATGQGLARSVDHALGEAGLSFEPTGTPSPR